MADATSIDRRETARRIAHWVQGGFHDAEWVTGLMTGYYFEGHPLSADDLSWIEQEIARQFASKQEQEARWPVDVEWDRLDRVFGALGRQRIIALHNAGYTMSEGDNAVAEAWDAAGSEASGTIGFAFYHGQDIEHAVEGRGLMLAYGTMDTAATSAAEIAGRIVEALRAAGFDVAWDGDPRKRIALPTFVWRKRTPA